MNIGENNGETMVGILSVVLVEVDRALEVGHNLYDTADAMRRRGIEPRNHLL